MLLASSAQQEEAHRKLGVGVRPLLRERLPVLVGAMVVDTGVQGNLMIYIC